MKLIKLLLLLFTVMLTQQAHSQNNRVVRIIHYGEEVKPSPVIFFSLKELNQMQVGDGVPHDCLNIVINEKSFVELERFLEIYKNKKEEQRGEADIRISYGNNQELWIYSLNAVAFFQGIHELVSKKHLDQGIALGIERQGHYPSKI